MSEEEAKEKGVAYKVGRFPIAASGKAMVVRQSDGFVKVVAEAETGQVLGVHMLAPDAAELIGLCSLAICLEATLDELIETYYPHPTVGEAIREAAMAAKGRAVHI